MELIFLWLNRSENGFLDNQCICLTSKYKVRFSIENNKMEIIKNREYFNIFNSGADESVINVSAIVGKNGTGKSTVLKHIFNTNLLPIPPKNKDGYEEFYSGRKELNQTIQIYEKDEDVFVYHNLDSKIDIKANIRVKECHLTVDTFNKYKDDEALGLTKIYLTNSHFTPIHSNLQSDFGKLSKVDLTIHNLENLSNLYFNPPSVVIDISDKFYMAMRLLSVKANNSLRFQSLLDTVYFEYLFSTGKHESFEGKVSTDLCLDIDVLLFKLEELVNNKSFNVKRYDFSGIEEKYLQRKGLWFDLYSRLGDERFNLATKLMFNLVCEIDYITDFLNHDDIVTHSIRALLDIGVTSTSTLSNEKIHEYYANANEDIKYFESIIDSIESIDNKLPTSDDAYKRELYISYHEDSSRFLMIVDGITSLFRKRSAVMKYLDITNLKFSSGERAYLNFFSWLKLIPEFHSIDPNIIKDLKGDVLLMIDEIDLYCHPEWQQKFIKYLVEGINEQFSEIKVQVIFTTHSPIVLSDIPSSNVIYTRFTDGKPMIFNSNLGETFASNIYKLFNDSFYLSDKGAIGRFAMDKINEVIRYIKYSEEPLRLDDPKLKIVDLIGEPIIKNKLSNLIKRNAVDDYDFRDRAVDKGIQRENDKIEVVKRELEKLLDTLK